MRNRKWEVGETRTVMTFLGTVEITRTKELYYRAEIAEELHYRSKAARKLYYRSPPLPTPANAMECLLAGVSQTLIRETIRINNID